MTNSVSYGYHERPNEATGDSDCRLYRILFVDTTHGKWPCGAVRSKRRSGTVDPKRPAVTDRFAPPEPR
jgi:hypothetical protein